MNYPKKSKNKKKSKFSTQKYWNSHSVSGENNVWRGIFSQKLKNLK